MNRRQKIIVSVTGIFLVLLILVGLTYAYFLTQIEGNPNTKSISVTTANLKVEYTDGDSDGDGVADNLITAEKIVPNTTLTPKVFNVENTGNAKASYSIVLDKIENDFDRNQDLKYTLTREGVTNPVAEGNLVVGTRQIILPKVEIEKDVTHTYTLTITYIEAGVDQSIDMNKALNLRVNIENETVTWDTAEEGTLLYALKNNQPTGGTETTIPGQAASTQNEKRILEAEDDYGTSYVYRGAVDNNYITYSNMCWRIVRVQGDGTIKLALADWAHPCGTKNGYSADDTDSALVADSDGNAMTEIAYKSTASFTITDFLFADSDIPLILSTWANDNNLDMSGLVETEWCNDTSVVGKAPLEFAWDEEPYEIYYYGARNRLYPVSTAEPTLKCNQKGMEGSTGIEAKATRYKNVLGILNADEIVFAGSTAHDKGTSETTYNYYLGTNATRMGGSWTMSPTEFNGENNWAILWQVANLKNWTTEVMKYSILSNGIEVDLPDGSVRPSVVLKSDVILDTETEYIQDGTIDTPYVIG